MYRRVAGKKLWVFFPSKILPHARNCCDVNQFAFMNIQRCWCDSWAKENALQDWDVGCCTSSKFAKLVLQKSSCLRCLSATTLTSCPNYFTCHASSTHPTLTTRIQYFTAASLQILPLPKASWTIPFAVYLCVSFSSCTRFSYSYWKRMISSSADPRNQLDRF